MSKLRVKEIAHSNGTVAASIDTAGNITGNAGLAGTPTTGMVLLASEQWTSDTETVDMMVIDSSKYQTYKLYWWISHSDEAGNTGTNNSWYQTGCTFLTAANTEVTSYDSVGSWWNSGSSSESYNNSYFGAQSCMWMAGNGATYDSTGDAVVFVPNSSSFRAGVRGTSMLIGTPRQSSSAGQNYLETFAGVALTQDPTAITGLRLRSWQGTSGRPSKHGTVHLYGLTG